MTSDLANRLSRRLALVLICIGVGAFVYPPALAGVILYLILDSIYETYILFKTASENPEKGYKLLHSSHGSGIPILFFLGGYGLSIYLITEEIYLTTVSTKILGFIGLGIILPSILATVVSVGGIKLIRTYK
jgi:hypothetical protein